MRLAKYLTVVILILGAAYTGFWYYHILHITKEINTNYASKRLLVNGVGNNDYYISFSKVVSYGFPLEFGIKIIGWKEESLDAEINYQNPILLRYDLQRQKLIASYTGDIIASYRPIKHNFGARLSIKDYFMSVQIPFSNDLLNTLANLRDPFEIINHFGKIKIGTDRVEIFDLNDGEKFYDKSHEQINVSFEPRKYYTSFEDLKENMPSRIDIDYVIKTEAMTAHKRNIPTSLFYGFYIFPSNFRAIGKLSLNIRENESEKILDNADIKLNFQISSQYFDVDSYSLDYKSYSSKEDHSRFALQNNVEFKSKKGIFTELFKQYGEVRHVLSNTFFGKAFINEIEYIIGNRQVFNFESLEDAAYNLTISLSGLDTPRVMDINLENFSLLSDQSGVRLTSHLNIQKPYGDIHNSRNPKWLSEGVVYLQNYPDVIDFFSGYIYRFGKYKFITDKARKVYSDVNKQFFKRISDHPNAKSRDLSFEYEISSGDLDNTKFGNIKIDQIRNLYQAELISRLSHDVNLDGDIIANMKEVIPDLDENSEIIQRIIPAFQKIQGLDGGLIDKSNGSILNKASELKENLDNILVK